MGGKASLILVVGFSMIMLYFGLNMNRLSVSATTNSTNHYKLGIAKVIAKSGLNVAASNLSRNKNWLPNSPYSYMGTDNLIINLKDSLGTKIVTSTGIYQDVSKTVEIKIALANFSEFAYFSNIEGNIAWTGKDSILGPFHTNDNILVKSHPYFAGPITSQGGIIKYFANKTADEPIIVGQYITGIKIDFPTDGITKLSTVASSNGYVFSGHPEVFLEFAGDSIRYKFNSTDPYTTVLGSDLTSTGIIYIDNGDLRVKGVVKGEWSIGCNKSVFLDDDIVYNDIPNPKDKNDPSGDLLGILAQHNVIVTDNTANSSDINICASIYCEDGGFQADNFDKRAVNGNINLIGGIIQQNRGSVGTYDEKGIVLTGFRRNYKYDSRLSKMVPPYYPSTNTFKIISWLE